MLHKTPPIAAAQAARCRDGSRERKNRSVWGNRQAGIQTAFPRLKYLWGSYNLAIYKNKSRIRKAPANEHESQPG